MSANPTVYFTTIWFLFCSTIWKSEKSKLLNCFINHVCVVQFISLRFLTFSWLVKTCVHISVVGDNIFSTPKRKYLNIRNWYQSSKTTSFNVVKSCENWRICCSQNNFYLTPFLTSWDITYQFYHLHALVTAVLSYNLQFLNKL